MQGKDLYKEKLINLFAEKRAEHVLTKHEIDAVESFLKRDVKSMGRLSLSEECLIELIKMSEVMTIVTDSKGPPEIVFDDNEKFNQTLKYKSFIHSIKEEIKEDFDEDDED